MKEKMTITPRAAAVVPLRTTLPDETTAGYTPGPWRYERATTETILAGNIEVAWASPLNGGNDAESAANAALIASAPRLLRERDTQAAEIAKLRAALSEIAERGPIESYTSSGALRLRLVATQCIARAALAVSGIGGPLGVKIEVSGGCAEVTECPESVRVTIIDHDNERCQ